MLRGAKVEPEGDSSRMETGAAGPGRRARKTSERVALDIVHDIVANQLGTGARLPLEAAMVDRYAVSRASLREALRLLETQGLIHIKPGPGGGPVVGAVEPANLARTITLYYHLGSATYGQLLDAQAQFEPVCAYLAARSPARRASMRPFIEPGGLVEPHDEPAYRATTVDFHSAIYELVANPVVTLVAQAITHIVTSHVVTTMDPIDLRKSILDDHATLARAVAAGQADRSRRLMAAHFIAQHDYYRIHWPARLAELIEWR